MCQSFFIHSSVYGHLGCFHIVTIVNSAAVNIGVHVAVSVLVSSGCMPVVGLLGHMMVLLLVFQGICIMSYEPVSSNGPEWVNLIQMTIISTTVSKNPLEEME